MTLSCLLQDKTQFKTQFYYKVTVFKLGMDHFSWAQTIIFVVSIAILFEQQGQSTRTSC